MTFDSLSILTLVLLFLFFSMFMTLCGDLPLSTLCNIIIFLFLPNYSFLSWSSSFRFNSLITLINSFIELSTGSICFILPSNNPRHVYMNGWYPWKSFLFLRLLFIIITCFFLHIPTLSYTQIICKCIYFI